MARRVPFQRQKHKTRDHIQAADPVGLRSMYLVPDELIDINERLINWGIWSRDHAKLNHCGSIEHKYTAPLVSEDDDHTTRRTPREVNQLDALMLFDLIYQLEPTPRVLIHLWYVHRASVGYIRRKLKLNGDRLIDSLNAARYHVRRLTEKEH